MNKNLLFLAIVGVIASLNAMQETEKKIDGYEKELKEVEQEARKFNIDKPLNKITLWEASKSDQLMELKRQYDATKRRQGLWEHTAAYEKQKTIEIKIVK